MRSHIGIALGLILASCFVIAASAADEKVEKKALKPADKNNPYKELLSGSSFLPEEIKAIQDDPFSNPANLALAQGEALWNRKEGKSEKSCAFCHNEAQSAMAGVGMRYPAYNKDKKKPITLEQRINVCREKHMKVLPHPLDADALIALTTYVKSFSKGRGVSVKVDGKMTTFFEAGRKDYYRRRGQLNMSCAQCHEDNVGKKLRGFTLSQGQGNGYPAFSISQEKIRTLHQRFQSCNRMVRSEPYELGSEDYVNLELYLAWRGKGLEIETPAVRN